MIEIPVRSGVSLRSLRQRDAAAMHQLIIDSRTHLDRWLRWSAALQSVDDVSEFVMMFEKREAEGAGFHLGMWTEDGLAGGVVCWHIDQLNRNAEVGYWLGATFTGGGLASAAARTVVGYLFESVELNRVEMQCGVPNLRSRRVAERCGLKQEGIRRESHWITDRFVDHVMYAALCKEWMDELDAAT